MAQQTTNTLPRYGSQKPRIDIFQQGDPYLADIGIELMESYGDKLLPWQEDTLRQWMMQDDNGDWSNHECGLLLPRQNGKTFLLRSRIITGMVCEGETLVYTAHTVVTVNEIKRLVFQFFYGAKQELRNMLTDEFNNEPKSLDYIELRNGGRCVFRTRTRDSGLGFTNDTLIVDEAQELMDAQEEALRPTISAGQNHNYQIIYAGTPPPAGARGTTFMRVRENTLSGKATHVAWREWSVETVTDPKVRQAWYDTNPSLGYFLQLGAVEAESSTMSLDSFNKMRLGWVRGVDSDRAFKTKEWNELAVKEVVLPDKPSLCYAVKFSPDRAFVSLAVGVVMPGDKIHVELIDRRPLQAGISWITRWLLPRRDKAQKIIIDGASGTQLLIEDLIRSDRRMKKKILTPNVREVGAGFGGFYQAVKNKTVTHYNQPALNMAIRVAKTRDIGRDGAFGFASINPEVQTDPVEAVALAHYGANRFRRVIAGNDGETQQEVMLW